MSYWYGDNTKRDINIKHSLNKISFETTMTIIACLLDCLVFVLVAFSRAVTMSDVVNAILRLRSVLKPID